MDSQMKNNLEKLSKKGVTFSNIDKVEIKGKLTCGEKVEIGTNIIFEGDIVLGNNVKLDSNIIITSSIVGDHCHIKSFSSIKKSIIGKSCIVGPFARLRTDSRIGDFSQIGNFVEIKNSVLGEHCRVNHMAFLGDCKLGKDVTIGAGTITCNHDGHKTNETIIESGVYVGSNVNLVAPIKISANATIGSGSTITSDVPEGKLTLSRSRQTTIQNWKGPRSKSK